MIIDMSDLGYVRGKIKLNATGIIAPLDNHFYRDDGVVDSLLEHSLMVADELKGSDKFVKMLKAKYSTEALGKGHQGHTICFDYVGEDEDTKERVKGLVLCKAIKADNRFAPIATHALELFKNGHEEAEVLYLTKNLGVLAEWFKERGYPGLYRRAYILRDCDGILIIDKQKEALCDLAGAVVVKSAGLRLGLLDFFRSEDLEETLKQYG